MEEIQTIIKDKILIKIELELMSGMHIGTNDGIATIGAVDSITVRDPISNKTMIPGSSLKGKIRRLLLNKNGQKEVIGNWALERLFGVANNKENNAVIGRLQFADALLTDKSAEELKNKETDMEYTEIKFENKIDPITLQAMPRQIERAVRGSKYDVLITYTLQDLNEVEEDFKNLKDGLNLLKYDYIGGSGSRGYGKIKFNSIEIEAMKLKGENLLSDKEEKIKEMMKEILK